MQSASFFAVVVGCWALTAAHFAGAPSSASEALMDAQAEVAEMSGLKSEVNLLVPRVRSGGRTAQKALATLIGLAAEPHAKEIVVAAGLKSICAKLMSSEASSSALRGLAGSLITLLTDQPVTSTVADEATGSFGDVEIVLPRPSRVYAADKALMELSSGVAHTARTAASFLALPPGVASGLYGDLVAHSDWQVNLQPPVEQTLDVEEALDTILQMEKDKQNSALAAFNAKKQGMIEAEKAKIRSLVRTSVSK